jgi:hypothetical protein
LDELGDAHPQLNRGRVEVIQQSIRQRHESALAIEIKDTIGRRSGLSLEDGEVPEEKKTNDE